jgi:hypothetical protein
LHLVVLIKYSSVKVAQLVTSAHIIGGGYKVGTPNFLLIVRLATKLLDKTKSIDKILKLCKSDNKLF